MGQMVRSGLITATMEVTPNGVAFVGPLAFDEEIVAAEGRWEFAVSADDGAAIADALSDAYLAEFDGWCVRKDAERAAREEAPEIRTRPGVDGRMHTPCPALWASR